MIRLDALLHLMFVHCTAGLSSYWEQHMEHSRESFLKSEQYQRRYFIGSSHWTVRTKAYRTGWSVPESSLLIDILYWEATGDPLGGRNARKEAELIEDPHNSILLTDRYFFKQHIRDYYHIIALRFMTLHHFTSGESRL